MTTKKRPLGGLAAAREAGEKTGYYQCSPLRPACQDPVPLSHIIQRILTNLLVLRRYPLKSSSLGVGRAGHE